MPDQFEMHHLDAREMQDYPAWWSELYAINAAAAESEGVQMARWLIASLLILNSGGLLATFNSASHIASPAAAAALFVAGILSAMFNGWLLQVSYFRTHHANYFASLYWRRVSISQRQIEAEEQKAWKLDRASRQFNQAAPFMGWLSIALFVGGVVTVACGFK